MGVATVLVLLIHGNEFLWPKQLGFALKLVSEGSIGVDVFLFLSGIGLFFSMNKDTSILKFYKRRFERIIPIYLLIAVPLYAILVFVVNSGSFFDYIFQISSFTYWYPNNNSFGEVWYVSFIIPLYLVYPLIYLSTQKNRKFFIVLIIFSFVIKVLLIYFNPEYYKCIESAVSRLPIFIIGCYCGLLVLEKKGLNIKRHIIVSFVCFLLIRVINIIFTAKESLLYESVVRISNIFLTFFIVFICCLLFSLFTSKSKILSIFNFFGKFSFEVYLTHRLISEFYKYSPLYKSYPQFWIYYILIVPVSILFAVLFSKLLCEIKRFFVKNKN